MKQHYEKYREGELYPATYEVIYAVVSKKNYKTKNTFKKDL
jgi:hypothetical protein